MALGRLRKKENKMQSWHRERFEESEDLKSTYLRIRGQYRRQSCGIERGNQAGCIVALASL